MEDGVKSVVKFLSILGYVNFSDKFPFWIA